MNVSQALLIDLLGRVQEHVHDVLDGVIACSAACVAAAIPRESTNGMGSRDPSGIRRPYPFAMPPAFWSTLDSLMPNGSKMFLPT